MGQRETEAETHSSTGHISSRTLSLGFLAAGWLYFPGDEVLVKGLVYCRTQLSAALLVYFGLLQRFKHLLPTSRDPAVPFPSAAPRLALSNPKGLGFSSCEPEKGAGLGSYSWLVRWPWVSAVLSLGERILKSKRWEAQQNWGCFTVLPVICE